MNMNRYWGLLPVFFALYTTIYYISIGKWPEVFWLCRIANYMLGIAILFSISSWIWISSLCLLVGTPLWILNVVATGIFWPHSFFIHVVSAILGLFALRDREKSGQMWWQAVLFTAGLQILSRYITLPEYNVNFSFAIYPKFVPYFPNFWSFWLLSLASFAGALFITERYSIPIIFNLFDGDRRHTIPP